MPFFMSAVLNHRHTTDLTALKIAHFLSAAGASPLTHHLAGIGMYLAAKIAFLFDQQLHFN
jgi:hypothetical protein